MALVTGRTQTASRLRKAADAAWETYASTCRMGGTQAERDWAFDQANTAEEKAAAVERTVRRTDA